jgi:hypothetical protein
MSQITINAELDEETKQFISELNARVARLEAIELKVDQIFNGIETLLSKPSAPAPEPEPIPTPDPEPINEQPARLGERIFFDDFENPKTWLNGGEINSSWYGNQGRSTISTELPFSGSNSLKMLTAGRNGEFYAQSNNWRYAAIKEGEDLIFKFKLFIPKNIGFYFPSGDWGFFNLFQFKGVGGNINNPLHCLYIDATPDRKTNYFSVGYMGGQWGDRNESFKQQNPIEIPIGEWMDLEVRSYMHDGQGIYQVYQNDQLIFDLKNQRTFRSGAGITRLDAGVCNYHRYARSYVNGAWDGLNGITMYVDDFAIHKTRLTGV